MILTGSEILKNIENKKIIIDPFDVSQLNPNSYNFTLSSKLLVYDNHVLDVKQNNPFREIVIPQEGLILSPGVVYLASTKETIGSDFFVPIIRGRSSIGRLGLFVNITADLIDLGSVNRITLQLSAVQPVTVYPGLQIGQVTFWQVMGEISERYSGRYKSEESPSPSKMYQDFE
ncbi:MAG: dCTP deaminase [Alphaproteobacteria bacterium]|nr:dCTP deaminase [Alphaproteobacteria bacterium]